MINLKFIFLGLDGVDGFIGRDGFLGFLGFDGILGNRGFLGFFYFGDRGDIGTYIMEEFFFLNFYFLFINSKYDFLLFFFLLGDFGVDGVLGLFGFFGFKGREGE